jgi:serine kinase of HPr protein (carbohydrate metabolism regulator)
MTNPTVHATCLLLDERGVLIRGPAGSGKTRLALALLDRWTARGWFACLVGDDRVRLTAHHGRLLAEGAAALAGLVELRGIGPVPIRTEPAAVVGLVVDILPVTELERMPSDAGRRTVIEGVDLPRLAVPGDPALAAPLIAATVGTGRRAFS